MLLQNAVKFNLREFQEVWQQSVPEGMGTRLDQLKVSEFNKQEFGYIHILCLMYVVFIANILPECCPGRPYLPP